MSNKRITPLEKLREEKLILKSSTRLQEDKLRETLDYIEDNIIPLSLGATAKALANPGKLLSSIRNTSSSSDQTSSGGNDLLGFLPKGVISFATRTALGLLIKKTFGRKSFLGKTLGFAIPFVSPYIAPIVAPIVVPVANATIKTTQPLMKKLMNFGAKKILSWKNNRTQKHSAN